MGTSFSTIQIKNRQQKTPEIFIELLSKYFCKKGLDLAAAENAEFSYRVAFSDESDWITICYDEQHGGANTRQIMEDTGKLAEFFKTYCIITSVWDSDFIEMRLFENSAKQGDYLWAGRHVVPDAPKMHGNQNLWESLLSKGATWGQFTEILDKSCENTFAEETFSKLAPLLGMSPKNIIRDYRGWEHTEPNNPNVHILHYRTKTDLPLLLTDGATRLKNLSGIGPCLVSDMKNYISFNNVGGISKGLSVCFLGECFKNDEVKVSELIIERLKDPKKKRNNVKYPDDYEIFSASLEKMQFSDGISGLIANIDDYVFFEGINIEHPSNKDGNKKYDSMVWDCKTIIRFTATILSGEQYILHIGVIPKENWVEGQFVYENVNLCLTNEMSYNYTKSRGSSTSQEDLAVLAKGECDNVSKITRIKAIKRLSDKSVLADIEKNTDDEDIRKAVSEKLAKLQ